MQFVRSISCTLPSLFSFFSLQKWCTLNLFSFPTFSSKVVLIGRNYNYKKFILITGWEIMHVMSQSAHTYYIWEEGNPLPFSFCFVSEVRVLIDQMGLIYLICYRWVLPRKLLRNLKTQQQQQKKCLNCTHFQVF